MSLNGKKEKIFNAINKSKIPEYTAQTNALSQVCMCVRLCIHSKLAFKLNANLSATLIIRSVVAREKKRI